jgi:hypothetical protein
MDQQDLASLSEKTREDGQRLFGVCELIYKIAIAIIFFMAIVGGIASIGMMRVSFPMGLGIAIAVGAFCFVNYMIAVLSTHVAKVLVHTSFSTLGLLEHFSKSTEAASLSKNTAEVPKSTTSEPLTSTTEIPLDENDPIFIEGTKIVNSLASNGYQLVKFDSRKRLWTLSGGSTEFECNLDQLRDLARNFI